jgi:hypothetical protein
MRSLQSFSQVPPGMSMTGLLQISGGVVEMTGGFGNCRDSPSKDMNYSGPLDYQYMSCTIIPTLGRYHVDTRPLGRNSRTSWTSFALQMPVRTVEILNFQVYSVSLDS